MFLHSGYGLRCNQWLIYWGKKNKLQWTCSLKEKSLLKNLQTQLWVKQPLASSIAFSVQQLSGAKEQRLKVSFCRHWVEVFRGILSECVPTCGRLCVAVYFRLAASLDWSGTQVIKLLAVKWWRPHDPPGHLLRGAVLLNHLNRDVLPDICLISSWVPQSWNLQLAGYTGCSCILSHSGPYRKLENNWMCMLLIKKNVTVKDPQ